MALSGFKWVQVALSGFKWLEVGLNAFGLEIPLLYKPLLAYGKSPWFKRLSSDSLRPSAGQVDAYLFLDELTKRNAPKAGWWQLENLHK